MTAVHDPSGQMQAVRSNLGALLPYYDDPTVSEIMLNGDGRAYVERAGKLYYCPEVELSDDALDHLIAGIARPFEMDVSAWEPILNVTLTDGTRVSIVIKSISHGGSSLNIRKFLPQFLQIQTMLDAGSITAAALDLIREYLGRDRNIVISGSPGVGKTSLVNALSPHLGEDRRIVVIEDTLELQLHQHHIARLVARTQQPDGRPEVTMRELVAQAMRMRPDRVIVGEVRRGEAFELLSALNTGQTGTLATMHANDARQTLTKLRLLVQLAKMDIDVSVIDEMIAENIHLVVHMRRDGAGRRQVQEIMAVEGVDASQRIRTRMLWSFNARIRRVYPAQLATAGPAGDCADPEGSSGSRSRAVSRGSAQACRRLVAAGHGGKE